MKKVYIGIPSSRYYEPFWESMKVFIPELSKEYKVDICEVKGMRISEARNTIASMFMKSDADYLLFLDDDHSGHTMKMFKQILDPLENNDSVMCGMKCYARIFPYNSNLLIYSGANEKELGIPQGRGKYAPLNLLNGYMYMDLVGFGMTILNKKAFEIIGEPYFISENNGHEDNYFCEKLIKNGVRPVGCFEDTLEHGGFGKHNVPQLYMEGIIELKNKFPGMRVLVS